MMMKLLVRITELMCYTLCGELMACQIFGDLYKKSILVEYQIDNICVVEHKEPIAYFNCKW